MDTAGKLHLGAAYHGNRMPHHAEQDLLDMATHGMDTVVHMLSHTDWNRHLNVIKDIIGMSADLGLESWVDNWGLAGSPGDTSHFLALYPDAHMVYSDGTIAGIYPCLYSPEYRKFSKDWIDAVEFCGAKTIFWDEPHLPVKKTPDGKVFHACACPRCRALFAEKYGREMPVEPDDDVRRFAAQSIADYFADVTGYSHAKGIRNAVCVMIGSYGVSLDTADLIAALPYMDNIGSDPYWIKRKKDDPSFDVYRFVRSRPEQNLDLSAKFEKDHNIWIQSYSNPRGCEDDIITAAEAAYDAGARTLLACGCAGSEANDYRAEDAAAAWSVLKEAFSRVRSMDRDRILAENRRNYR